MLRRFTVSDVLGFCRFVWYSQDEQACMVLPRCNTLSRLPLPRSLSAEDGVPNQSGSPQGDRMEIRPYTPGDSVRDILWKAYARNRQLNVRLAEKSLSHNTRTLAYLLSGPDDEAAAAAARLALESGALGEDWLFGTDGTAEPCPTLAGALQAVAASRPLDGAHPYGLDGFLKAAGALQATGASQTAGAAMPHCLIFAAASGGPWLAHLKRTIASGRGRFSLILATDGFRQTRQESLYRRWGRRMLLRPDVAQEMSQEVEQETQLKTSMESMDRAPSRETLLALLRSLIVESVLVIDRRNGLCFNGNLRPI